MKLSSAHVLRCVIPYALFGALVLAGCGGGGGGGAAGPITAAVRVTPSTVTVDEMASVVVTVTNTGTGLPVRGAKVKVKGSGKLVDVYQSTESTAGDGTAEAVLSADRACKAKVSVKVEVEGQAPVEVAEQPTVAFVSGDAAPGWPSELLPDRNTALANGTDAITVRLLLCDELENPVAGRRVRVSASGSGHVVDPPIVTTDASGQAEVRVTSTVAEVKTITATIAPESENEIELDDAPDVEFLPSEICPSALRSTCTANPTTGLLANGLDRSKITVTVVDANGRAIAGVPVVLSVRGLGATIHQPAPTDANGAAAGAVSSTVPGLVIVTATTQPFGNDPRCEEKVVIRQQALVLFGKAPRGGIVRCSEQPGGGDANDKSKAPAISGDGRWVVFESKADNLVRGDTNKKEDIFVCDRTTGQVARVSVSSGGGQADDKCKNPDISGDGRYVVFESKADNLVRGDTNRKRDVFVHDRRTGETRRVSVDSAGGQADGDSKEPRISADGRIVVFVSKARNLVRGDTNRKDDVFVHDLTNGRTIRVSVSSTGAQADDHSRSPSISGDGNRIAFESKARNLSGTNVQKHKGKGRRQIFVRDLAAGRTGLASVNAVGEAGDKDSKAPSISGDGRFVVFETKAANLARGDTNRKTDIYLRDLRNGTTDRVSVAANAIELRDDSREADVSGDGRYVVFKSKWSRSWSPPGKRKEQIFVRDRRASTTTPVSVNAMDEPGDDKSSAPAISSDGGHVVFVSKARNLVPGDTNRKEDVFVAGSAR